MPVATLGAVKGIPPATLEELGGRILLANLYHLALRPGVDAIEALGGLHAFTAWPGPILTDSGGYQVFSLAARRSDRRRRRDLPQPPRRRAVRFTPESVVDMQRRLGWTWPWCSTSARPGR
jgi:queuine tRNA-ribosyltransferase